MNRRLDIYGEQFWRPYCHTNDLATACILAATAPSEQVACEALNVGDTTENYNKKMLAELIVRQLPERATNVHYVKKDEDPRDYRVRCDKIKQAIGFEITRRVPDGIREIIDAVSSGLIDNPDDEYYVND
jgi:nucleoside-diphosphate-sugar epimerase